MHSISEESKIDKSFVSVSQLMITVLQGFRVVACVVPQGSCLGPFQLFSTLESFYTRRKYPRGMII